MEGKSKLEVSNDFAARSFMWLQLRADDQMITINLGSDPLWFPVHVIPDSWFRQMAFVIIFCELWRLGTGPVFRVALSLFHDDR